MEEKQQQNKSANGDMQLLNMVATFHTLTSPILIGFFSLLLEQKQERLQQLQAKVSSLGFFVSSFISVGLLLYFATFFLLFYAYGKDKKINLTYLTIAFYMSIATSLIFVGLIMSQILAPT